MEKLSRALETIALNWFARNMPVSEPEGLKVGDKIESDQYSGYEPSLTQYHLACQSFGSNLALMYISRWYIRIYTHIYTSYNLLHSSISETKKISIIIWLIRWCLGQQNWVHVLTHLLLHTMALILADEIFKCILLMKWYNFDSNFTEICSQESNWQWGSTGSGNGLAPYRRQAITCTNADQFTDAHMRHLGDKLKEVSPEIYHLIWEQTIIVECSTKPQCHFHHLSSESCVSSGNKCHMEI